MRPRELAAAIESVRQGAMFSGQVEGATHQFYRYPARFSPQFARSAIDAFSKPGDLVMDPFMGGGTTVVETLLAGRRSIGNDLNSLGVFLAQVKTTPLTQRESDEIRRWLGQRVPTLTYDQPLELSRSPVEEVQLRNMGIPRARPIKKVIGLALESLSGLESESSRRFARCIILNAGQWALNGRKRAISASDFREYLSDAAHRMLHSIANFEASLPATHQRPTLVQGPADALPQALLLGSSQLADLVVTSPPYPGIHLLYHRWQVDGRKETPAPYWIAGCADGKGAAYYNIADRRDEGAEKYFAGIETTFRSLRHAIKPGGFVVQLLAFSNPRTHLRRYLSTMSQAGFTEVAPEVGRRRIWRGVPRRSWHATSIGKTSAAREVVLIHQAD